MIVAIDGLEARPDAHFVVGTHAVVAPPHAARFDVIGGDVSADALLSAHDANDHL